MKVYVDLEDKDFLDACLSECRVYEYVADELQYRDRLKLVNIADYIKQVRKEVCGEIKKIFKECCIPASMIIKQEDLWAILDQIQGETK